ncbi:MAG: hypothetical protein A3G18_10355 [Rhodospirillales bacterium RIFCSPLOWO2_12_FULL_58_28]|nr:MAG: hypothetical protein A3H92_08530 [Rhodospirillales bacterium RIFCSPLOWO2_02_FULL_58_16]OHC77679.1 MAG: hypothetical protein A3G18_10355 [Rhodospirillales bacterium RIFCSPLOWO2_12_FULL_58_28]
MATQLELARHRLFDEDALYVANIKLFPGSKRDATAEEVAQEINKAIAQVEAGDFDNVDDFNDC